VLAVIVVVPAPTAVTIPVELTVATLALLEAQVAVLVMSWLLEGWSPWPMDAVAVSCTVAPGAKLAVVGDTVMESTSVEEPQPANGKIRLTNNSARKQERPSIELSSRNRRAETQGCAIQPQFLSFCV
jgi:hypothetical protein